jgi:hypothetical protein
MCMILIPHVYPPPGACLICFDMMAVGALVAGILPDRPHPEPLLIGYFMAAVGGCVVHCIA